jgi:hypothetical protein
VAAHFSANEATALMQAAIAGAGIALLPAYLINAELAAGRLRPVLADWAPPTLAIQALYPSRRQLSPALRALLDDGGASRSSPGKTHSRRPDRQRLKPAGVWLGGPGSAPQPTHRGRASLVSRPSHAKKKPHENNKLHRFIDPF